MTCPATPLRPATDEDALLAPAVGDGWVPLADELVLADPELFDDPAAAEPDAGVSERPVAAPAPEAVPPVAGCVPTLAPVEGCIAEDPEVVEPEPVAAGRSVAPEGPGLAGAVDWASAGAAASAVATRHAAICNFNIDDLPAGVSPGARRGGEHRQRPRRDLETKRRARPGNLAVERQEDPRAAKRQVEGRRRPGDDLGALAPGAHEGRKPAAQQRKRNVAAHDVDLEQAGIERPPAPGVRRHEVVGDEDRGRPEAFAARAVVDRDVEIAAAAERPERRQRGADELVRNRFAHLGPLARHPREISEAAERVKTATPNLAEVDAALVRRGELAHRFLDIRRHAEVLGEEIVGPERQDAERNAGSGEALDRGRHRAVAARDDHRPRLRGGLIESVLQFPRGDRMNVAWAARRREGALDSGAEILAGKCRGRTGGCVDEDDRLHEGL